MDEETFYNRVNKDGAQILDTPCWEWTGWKRRKYGVFNDYKEDGTRTTISSHRWLWEQENGPIPPGSHLCHRCDNEPCVRPSHMFLGSRVNNMRDMLSKGRKKTTLTNDQVVEARRRAALGESVHSINRDFRVNTDTLARAIRGISFPHLEEPPVENVSFAKFDQHGVLTEQQVKEIKTALEKPYWGQQKALAKKYGVTPSAISNIRRGITYSIN